MEDERQLVDVAGVGGVDDGLGVDVAQVGDLHLQVVRQRPLAAAHDEIGLDAAAAQLGDRVLRRLRLLLARRTDERHECHVHVADVVAPSVLAELPDRFEERQDLDVADRAADLGDDHVDVVADEPGDAPTDLVGDMGDDLHRLAEVVAAPLGGEHRLVDRPGGGVGVARQVLVDETLVVPEVEVGLAAVVGDEHLAVLERVHRPRVDVDVRVELLQRHAQTPLLEQAPERGRREALAQRAGNTTRHEDVLGHRGIALRLAGRCQASASRTGSQPTATGRGGEGSTSRAARRRDAEPARRPARPTACGRSPPPARPRSRGGRR